MGRARRPAPSLIGASCVSSMWGASSQWVACAAALAVLLQPAAAPRPKPHCVVHTVHQDQNHTVLLQPAAATRPKPHVLFVLADDLGWANVGFHRETPTPEVQTPLLDGLVKTARGDTDPRACSRMVGPNRGFGPGPGLELPHKTDDANAARTTAAVSSATKPHIVFVMADDLGSADVGRWQNAVGDPTSLTPELDQLAANGVVLTECYTWSWCAPSRGAFLSGRYAPNTGFEGAGGGGGKVGAQVRVFPTDQPLLPAILKRPGANYSTLMVGKWHLGFARPMDTPEGRGFDTFLGFFEGGEDYYDHTLGGACGHNDVHDLWYANTGERSRPAVEPARSGTYSTKLYTEFVVNRIGAHAAKHGINAPLFVYAAYQGVHYPLQVPKHYFDRYAAQGANAGDCLWENQTHTRGGYPNGFVCDGDPSYPFVTKRGLNCKCNRLLVKAQVSALSEGVGNISAALKANGMWERTVLVFQGDNGGPTDGAHSNVPLRGGKLNFFEGGVRPAAFVASPLLPKAVMGTVYRGIIHETDWLVTFATLAGASLPPDAKHDGLDFWPTLVNPTTPHRTEVLISDKILRVGRFKLVTGASHGTDPMNWYSGNLKGCMLGTGGGWMAPSHNKSATCPGDIYTTANCHSCLGCPQDENTEHPVTAEVDLWLCSDPCTDVTPCLWDLHTDPFERDEISVENPAVVATMLARLHELQDGFLGDNVTNSGMLADNGRFCEVLNTTEVQGFGVFVGPWMPDPH